MAKETASKMLDNIKWFAALAVFSAADGGAYKYEENQAITDTTTIRDIYSDVVIVQDGENNLFEVYMNNIIKPSEG